MSEHEWVPLDMDGETRAKFNSIAPEGRLVSSVFAEIKSQKLKIVLDDGREVIVSKPVN